MRANAVKKTLKAGQPSVGTWLSLGSITASRFMARCGFAWLTVDIEHSLCDWETATHIFASVADAGCVALARVPANRHDHIKRVGDDRVGDFVDDRGGVELMQSNGLHVTSRS